MLCSPILDDSSKIIITVLHNPSMLKDKCLGKVVIGLERLFELQHSQPNEGK